VLATLSPCTFVAAVRLYYDDKLRKAARLYCDDKQFPPALDMEPQLLDSQMKKKSYGI
jgi:hypothetical protein